MSKKELRAYFPIFALPTFIAFMIGFVVPFGLGIYLSFCDIKTTVTSAIPVGLKNYQDIFSDSGFIHALWLTAVFAVVSIVTINFFGFAIAMLLTKGIRGTTFFRTVFFMPNLIGGIVLGWLWKLIFNAVLMNVFNVQAGLEADPKYGFWGLVILMNWQQIGYMMIIYIAGIQNVPPDLIEAAKIDGATGRQVLGHVILPMTMPSITICTFLTLTNSFKLFDQNYALTRNSKARLLAYDIYSTFYEHGEGYGFEGKAQAKAVIFSLIVAGIAVVQLAMTKRKEVQQ